MLFPSPSTWKMIKDAPNYNLINMIGLAYTSRKITENGDVPILPVVLITPDYSQLTVLIPVSHYPTSTLRLIQYLYMTVRSVPACDTPPHV